MLLKRIDLGSIPVGFYKAGEDIVKGRAVVVRDNEVYHCATADEAKNPLGFATLVIDTKEGGDIADHDVIKKGKPVVVYTIVKNNMWGTTEFVGDLKVGDKLAVDYSEGNEGKLIKATAEDTAIAEVFDFSKAGSYDVVDFMLL